jgi:DNA-binding response OmpR family regulator
MKLLIIEDDPVTRAIVLETLKDEGLELHEAANGTAGMRIVKDIEPEIIILDLGLPDMSGLSVAFHMRMKSSIYGNPHILMLTAKTANEDVIEGFERGADDYLKKPFEPQELLFRIRSLMKRRGKITSQVFKYKDIIIDLYNSKVTEKGEEVHIPKKEMELLVYMIMNKGVTLSRERLLDEIWDAAWYPENRTVDMSIQRLRQRLETFNQDLETVRGFGYRLG